MALFRKKEKPTPETDARAEKTQTKATTAPSLVAGRDLSAILRAPRVTEKATFANEQGAYVFEVDPRATKRDVAQAVQAIYKVTPRKVNMVRIVPKKIQSRRRGIFGRKPSGKKAYVYLKEGDVLQIV